MLFHTWTFAAFFVLLLGLHRVSPVPVRRYVLLAGSYLFYGWWNPYYTLLILGSTGIDYWAARRIQGAELPGKRRLFLVVSLVTNLGLLGIFKYYDFFAESLDPWLPVRVPTLDLLLPVGISFFTFQSMSYTIDVYRGRLGLARDFVDFALFVSFFPQLVAGPIVRASQFLPQLESTPPRSAESVREGLKLFSVGLFKKVVIADNLGVFVDAVHSNPSSVSAGDLWVSSWAFAFQIYYDFSAYSEMAIGLARMLGYELPENFRRPYLARNFAEFWRRWHISLSTWLRDYLYIPLGGNRGSRAATLRNLTVTMVLGGLWHGANWTFVLWGFAHGALLVIHRLWRRAVERWPLLRALSDCSAMAPLWILLTFNGWALTMVLFRAESIAVGASMLGGMFTGRGGITAWGVLGACALLYLLQWINELYDLLEGFERLPLLVRSAVIVVGVWCMILFAPKETAPFIYFQF